jgi:MFS family permease
MKKIKVIILSLSLITVMSGAATAPALGSIAVYFKDVDPIMIKLIITIPSLFIIFTSLLFGQIVSKISAKTIAIIGLILYLVGGCGAGFVNDIYLLLLFRVFLGVGVGLIMPLSTGLIPYFFDKNDQSELMGYSSAMNNLGGIIALGLSGILVSINWRYSFSVYLLGLLELILVVLFLPNVNLKKTNSKIDKVSARKILPYIISMFLIMIIFYTIATNFSIIMTKESIVPTTLIGVLMSVQNFSAFIVGIKLSIFTKKFKENTKYVAVSMLIIGFFILGITSSVSIIILGLLFLGIGMGIIVPLLNAQISLNIEKEQAPSAMALMSFMLYLGQFLSPIIMDFVIKILKLNNIRAPFYLAGVMAIILIISIKRISIKDIKR